MNNESPKDLLTSKQEQAEKGDENIEALDDNRPSSESNLSAFQEKYVSLEPAEQERLSSLNESMDNIKAALEVIGEEGEDVTENRFIAYQGIEAMRDVYDEADMKALGIESLATSLREELSNEGIHNIEMRDRDVEYTEAKRYLLEGGNMSEQEFEQKQSLVKGYENFQKTQKELYSNQVNAKAEFVKRMKGKLDDWATMIGQKIDNLAPAKKLSEKLASSVDNSLDALHVEQVDGEDLEEHGRFKKFAMAMRNAGRSVYEAGLTGAKRVAEQGIATSMSRTAASGVAFSAALAFIAIEGGGSEVEADERETDPAHASVEDRMREQLEEVSHQEKISNFEQRIQQLSREVVDRESRGEDAADLYSQIDELHRQKVAFERALSEIEANAVVDSLPTEATVGSEGLSSEHQERARELKERYDELVAVLNSAEFGSAEETKANHAISEFLGLIKENESPEVFETFSQVIKPESTPTVSEQPSSLEEIMTAKVDEQVGDVAVAKGLGRDVEQMGQALDTEHSRESGTEAVDFVKDPVMDAYNAVEAAQSDGDRQQALERLIEVVEKTIQNFDPKDPKHEQYSSYLAQLESSMQEIKDKEQTPETKVFNAKEAKDALIAVGERVPEGMDETALKEQVLETFEQQNRTSLGYANQIRVAQGKIDTANETLTSGSDDDKRVAQFKLQRAEQDKQFHIDGLVSHMEKMNNFEDQMKPYFPDSGENLFHADNADSAVKEILAKVPGVERILEFGDK